MTRAVIPEGGIPAWAQPDGAAAPQATIAPGTEVDVAEVLGDWARVVCDNGWTGWVDARRFQVAGAEGAATDGRLAVVGAGVALTGAFLPWLTGHGVTMSAWEVSIRFLVGFQDDISGPKVGLLLLVPLLAVVPLLTRRPLTSLGWTALAAAAVDPPLMALMRVRAMHDGPSLGVGVWITLAGGLLITVEALGAGKRR